MTRYISTPISVDRGSVKAEMVDSLEASVPGLEVAAGTTLDYLLDVAASNSAADRQLFTEQLAEIFRYSGEKIDRIPIRTAVQATGETTWVRLSTDTGARTVPAGTQIEAPGADGELVTFELVTDLSFAALDLTETGVDVIATTGGVAGNGVTGVAQPASTLSWLESVTITAPTSGGEDAEDVDEYLDRLADTRPLNLNAIVSADDLARWLRNQTGVDRALAIDNYNADTDTADQPGHLTAWPVDAAGEALSSGELEALQAAAQEITLTNLYVHVEEPVYTLITVVFAGVARAGYDPADVEVRAENAVLDFLDPAQFGLPETGDERLWLDVRTVRFQDVVTVLNNVEGFAYYTSLTINGGTSDVTVTGPGGLPDPDSTASGTVAAP